MPEPGASIERTECMYLLRELWVYVIGVGGATGLAGDGWARNTFLLCPASSFGFDCTWNPPVSFERLLLVTE